MNALRRVVVAVALAALASAPLRANAPGAVHPHAPLPERLSETGLFERGTTTVRAGNVAFSPQYPLWSDGAAKRRWIRLPEGTAIDASRPDAFEFPPGTRLWKQFAMGRLVETRLIERLADGSWRFATYVWNEEGTDAELAPEDGTVVQVAGAPGGRYEIPSRADCLACHEGAPVPVLGFGALQLSSDRDPLAPHAETPGADFVDLATLVRDGTIRNLPSALSAAPPRIDAPTPVARAALGYLHANCGHCHNADGPLAKLDLALAQRAGDPKGSADRTLRSLIGHESRFRANGAGDARRVVAGDAGESVIVARMRSRNPLARMPPLAVRRIDDEGAALVARWIEQDLQPRKENAR